MHAARRRLYGLMALLVIAAGVAPAGATTLMRESLDKLVAGNRTVIVGEVLDADSHWNTEGTFILTDVRVAVTEVLKGRLADRELTVTLMGGRVGDTTTLIVGGAELIPGNAYVLFLNEDSLPGARALTVRDLCQGAFDLVMTQDGLRAVSQANRHPLVPDELGYLDAPGGVEGIPFNAMVDSIRELAERPQGARREVN